LSLILLLGAGLLIRSLARLLDTDPGFQPGQVITFQVTLPGANYPMAPQRIAFFDQLSSRLAAIPGVETAGAVSDLPFAPNRNSSPFSIVGRPEVSGEPARHADMRFVQADYFRVMAIPLIRGRTFAPSDRLGGPWVSVIDESLARQYFEGQDPIGQTISQGGPTSVIIGVVGAIKHGDLSEPDKATIYYAYSQAPWQSGLYLAVRTSREPVGFMAQAREAVAGIDPKLPVHDVRLMEERVEDSLGARRLAMMVLSGFALLALLLALLGVYGVLSYIISRRTHELGIRLALGAVPSDVVRMVLGSGLALTGVGLAIGLAGFLLLARLLSSLLYGVSPRDPLTIAVGTGLLALGAVAAALVPALRAARVDPMETLKEVP
jgi:putative ABC transport system permease protein